MSLFFAHRVFNVHGGGFGPAGDAGIRAPGRVIQNFTAGLAQHLADKGILVNCVAPGPTGTPPIPSTMPEEKVRSFGKQVPMQRPGQPAEVAPAYVLLAADEASYISGATIAVTGGKPILYECRGGLLSRGRTGIASRERCRLAHGSLPGGGISPRMQPRRRDAGSCPTPYYGGLLRQGNSLTLLA